MFRYVAFVKRRRDLTVEQFRDHWLREHAKLERVVLEKTRARRIVVNFVADTLTGEKPLFDAFVEICFENIEDINHFRDSGVLPTEFWAEVKKDEANFVDLDDEKSHERVRIITEEFLIGEKR